MSKPWEHAKSAPGSDADELAARFVSSLAYDRRLAMHDIAGSVAHARMLRKVGLITAADLRAIERGLKSIAQEIARFGDDWKGWRLDLEDVHMCIESALIEKVGDPGRKLHTGRSRNDQVALDLRLWAHAARDEIDDELLQLMGAFVALAEAQGTIVMPSYTHLQRAQPIVLGGELLAWAEALNRASLRFVAMGAIDPTNPLGSGAIAGSSLPLDRDTTTRTLASGGALPTLTLPGDSSIDATASRDVAVDFVYALAMTAMTLSRWAEQWILYCSTEFGFLKLGEAYTTGSSMMPQKRNPDMLELIRGKCGGVYGNLVALLTTLKGLPIGYNRDLQEDKRHVFEAFDAVKDCLAMATRMVKSARFDQEKIGQSLDRGFLDATSLAEYLVTKGVPFRTAHQIVGGLVRQCESQGRDRLAQLDVPAFNKACTDVKQRAVVKRDVYDWLGAANVVKRYRTQGNAGLAGLQAQLKLWSARLK